MPPTAAALPRAHTLAGLLLAASFAAAASAQSTLQTFQGNALGSRFGASVALVPDLDGDGKADLVVGCPSDDTNGDDAGAVRIYSGASGILLRTHLGDATGDRFGYSVAPIGDINNDGRGDYAVGIPYSDASAFDAGQVRLFSGVNGAVLTTMLGASAGDRFGWSVRGLGNFHGAAKEVIAIGAPYVDVGSASGAGAVYLRHYDNTIPAFGPSTLLGGQANEHFGWSVDGIRASSSLSQLAVGAPGYDAAGGLTDAGRFEIWQGNAANTLVKVGNLIFPSANAEFGTSVAFCSLGTAGTLHCAAGAPGAGSVPVFAATLAGAIQVTSFGGGGRFGEALASGNSHSQTTATLYVGAPDAILGNQKLGTVTAFNSLVGPTLGTLTGTDHEGRFGAAIAGGWAFGSDATGDGLDEVIVGAPESDTICQESGLVRVHASQSFTLWKSIDGPAFGDGAGRSVAGIGDVNQDGVPDVLVGCPLDDSFVSFPFPAVIPDCGSAKVISGATGAVLRTHLGAATGDEFGWSVAALGDLNLDGIGDYAVGAPQRNASTGKAGYARVYSGANGAQLYSFSGVLAGDQFGFALGGGSDLNQDGRPDLLVGAPGTVQGTVYAYSGSNGASLGSVQGTASGDQFGYSVAGLGADLNGDGKQDYIVGAPFRDSLVSDGGAAYVMTSVSSLTFQYVVNGTAAGDHAGWAVCKAGDVNQDGAQDFIVGIPGYDSPGSGAGRIRVFSGASGAQLATISGEGASDGFGYSVAGLGDVDNDGCADYAAGTLELNFILPDSGYLKVFSGKTSQALFTIDGLAGEAFGVSLAAAGDVDQDGIPDLVAGGPYASPTSVLSSEGVARIVSCRPAGTQFYGVVPNGCAGPQLLAPHGVPTIGNITFGYRVNHAPANALGLLLIANAQDPNPNGTDTFGIGVPMLVDFFSATEVYGIDITSDAFGFGATDTAIANNVNLKGLHYYAQTVWAWAGACSLPPFNLSGSSALKVTIL